MKFHVAIMKKSWGMVAKILSGEKTIESRWYLNRARPWGAVASGDKVFFKNSGEPVTVLATVTKVLEFENLTAPKVLEILRKYGKEDGIENVDKYYKLFQNKKYCILVFLKNPQKITPFNINKSGFGSMSAWLTVSDIEAIKV